MNAHPCLILPYLDREFQSIACIQDHDIDRLSRYALLACPTLIASPDFFVESTKAYGSIITSREFLGTNTIKLSVRDESLLHYWSRKQTIYAPFREHYPQYFDSIDKHLHKLAFPIRRRKFEIADRIKSIWTMAALSEGTFSFRHMVREVRSKMERDAILDVLRTVPSEIRDSPFVWENVCAIMDIQAPTWGNTMLKPALRTFLLKSFFEALCEADDSVVAFSDFPILGVADNSISVPTLPLNPIISFLAAGQVLDVIHRMPAFKFLEVISGPACEGFRREYLKVVQILKAQSEREKYDMEQFSYHQAVELANFHTPWLERVLKRAASLVRWPKGTRDDIRPLLERAAAQGFVKYIEQVAEEQLDFWTRLKAEISLSSAKSVSIVINMQIPENKTGDIYIVGQAGAVGTGAIALGNNLQLIKTNLGQGIDPAVLGRELEKLRLAMRTAATTPDQDTALGHVAAAQIECKKGNMAGALESLKKAGKWAFEQAKEIGVEVAASAINKQLGGEP